MSLPPEPKRVTGAQIEETILSILQNGCDTRHKGMMMKVKKVVETRGYVCVCVQSAEKVVVGVIGVCVCFLYLYESCVLNVVV